MNLLIIVLIIIVICILFGNKQENFRTDETCCLQGWYGPQSPGGIDCKKCPVDKPSSPRTPSGGPGTTGCPNEAASSCFACSNACRPFNPATGICTEICKACKVKIINGVKTATNCN